MSKKSNVFRPVDGEFKFSAAQRRSACVKAGHPMIYVNCSLSRYGEFEVRRCLCGAKEGKFPQGSDWQPQYFAPWTDDGEELQAHDEAPALTAEDPSVERRQTSPFPPAPASAPSDRPCIHAKLQLQLVVPEECLVRGDIGAWYACLQCGEHFRSDIKPYKLVVSMGAPAAQAAPAPSQPWYIAEDGCTVTDGDSKVRIIDCYRFISQVAIQVRDALNAAANRQLP